MEIFKGDWVRLKNGKIGHAIEVVNIRHWNDREIVKCTQEIYTDLRQKPYTLDEIDASAFKKEDLYKRKKKVAE